MKCLYCNKVHRDGGSITPAVISGFQACFDNKNYNYHECIHIGAFLVCMACRSCKVIANNKSIPGLLYVAKFDDFRNYTTLNQLCAN